MTNRDVTYIRDYSPVVAIILLIVFAPLALLYVLCAPKVAVQRVREPFDNTAQHRKRIKQNIKQNNLTADARARAEASYKLHEDKSNLHGLYIFLALFAGFAALIIFFGI